MTQPETLTPRQLAERLGFKPHYGNQLAKEGRFVFAPDGKHVLVQESIARFHATKDPSKQGVADRHAAGRAAAAPAQAEPPQDGERKVELRRVGDVALVAVVYHVPAIAHEDSAALELLESILTTPPSGRHIVE